MLQMPIDRFWVFEKNVSRIQASKNLERLQIQAGSQSKDGYESLHSRFTQEVGVVALTTPKLDRKGLNDLKELQQGPIK